MKVFLQQIKSARDDWHLEELARSACGAMKSIAGMCLTPLVGDDSKLFVQNSYSVGKDIPTQILSPDNSRLALCC